MGKKTAIATPPKDPGSSTPKTEDPTLTPPEELTPYELLGKAGLLQVKKIGRPPAEIDPYHVELLASCFCSKRQIGLKLGISVDTINRRFQEAYEKGINHAEVNLKARQQHFALRGDRALLIFLGKVHLGQRETTEIPPGGPNPNHDGRAPEDMTREELLEIARQGRPERGGNGRGVDATKGGRGDLETGRGNEPLN